MNPKDSLQLIRALQEKEETRKRGGNALAWGSVLFGAAILGLFMQASVGKLAEIESTARAAEAGLAEKVAARDSQVAELESALNRTSADLSSRNAAFNQLTIIFEQMKIASGITEKAGRDLLLTLSDQNTVTFDVAQDKLTCEQEKRLSENLTLLRYAKTFPDFRMEITGHTDDRWRGRADHSQAAQDANKDLSSKRAIAVRDFLKGHGIPESGIHVEGRGMRWPVGELDAADLETVGRRNADEPARRANRRVEILIKGVNLNVPSPRKPGV